MIAKKMKWTTVFFTRITLLDNLFVLFCLDVVQSNLLSFLFLVLSENFCVLINDN